MLDLNWLRSEWVCVIALAAALSGCGKAKPGDGCLLDGVASCEDPSTFAICRGGKMDVHVCRGPKGCTSSASQVLCDESVAADGDTCSDEGKAACSVDGKAFFRCSGGKYTDPTPCRGPKSCYRDGTMVRCDESLAEDGDRCGDTDNAACTADGKTLLHCKDRRFGNGVPCRGPKGCFQLEGQIHCDESIGVSGEACTAEGQAACSEDKKTFLLCKSGSYGGTRTCGGPKGCYRDGNMIRCDESVGVSGGACTDEGKGACSEDARALLVCAGGRYVASPCGPGKTCQQHDNRVLCDR